MVEKNSSKEFKKVVDQYKSDNNFVSDNKIKHLNKLGIFAAPIVAGVLYANDASPKEIAEATVPFVDSVNKFNNGEISASALSAIEETGFGVASLVISASIDPIEKTIISNMTQQEFDDYQGQKIVEAGISNELNGKPTLNIIRENSLAWQEYKNTLDEEHLTNILHIEEREQVLQEIQKEQTIAQNTPKTPPIDLTNNQGLGL